MVLTDTPVKNALAEAQLNKKKRVDSSARKKIGNAIAKNGSASKAKGKGKKPAPKKAASKKTVSKICKKHSDIKNNADSSKKTCCLVCGESFEEDWVQCLECHEWAHDNCTDGNDYYVCHNCDDSLQHCVAKSRLTFLVYYTCCAK